MEIPPDGHYISSGLMLLPQHAEAIDRLLAELCRKVPSRLGVVLARDGQFIAAQGEACGQVDLVSLGALIAGDHAASQAIAQLTGGYEEFQSAVREGKKHNLLVIDAGPHLVLFVLAAADVPVGWVRLLTMEAARRLAKIAQTMPGDPGGEAWGAGEADISDQVDQALRDLWSTG